MQYPRLEDKIFFTKDKHDREFGTAYLRTKLRAERERNHSIFNNPIEIRTDDFEWITRSYENDIKLDLSSSILTLPKLYKDTHPNYVSENKYVQHQRPKAVLAKSTEPFENRRKKLQMYSKNLKLANTYLSEQKQKYSSSKYTESDMLRESEQNIAIPIDYDFHCDDQLLKSSVFTTNNDFGDTILEEDEEGDSEEEGEEYSISETHMSHNRPFFVDTYTDESVQRLLSNIEALHLDPSKSFEAPPFLNEEAAVLEAQPTVSVSVEAAKKQSRPNSRGKNLKYDPLYQPPSKTENLLELTNQTLFDLSADKQITMGQMDRCIFRNSRRFGTRFDEKVLRKKTIIQGENRNMRKAMRQAQLNVLSAVKLSHSPLFGAMRGVVSAAGETNGAGLSFANGVLSKMKRAHTPLSPMAYSTSTLGTDLHQHHLHHNNLPFDTPTKESQKAKLLESAALTPIATVSRADYQFADYVRPKSARSAEKHPRNPFEKSAATDKNVSLMETKRLLRAHDLDVDLVGETDENSVVPQVTLSVMKETLQKEMYNPGSPSILFDLNTRGKIVEVVLRSEQLPERPKSANKLVRGLADKIADDNFQKTHKSMQSLLTKRRKYVKPMRVRKNLTTIVPISEEDADVERRALISIFEMCGGRNWINNSNWCSAVPVKQWWGVGVTVEGYVFEVDLTDNNLCGPFPDSLALLSRLEVVLLDHNHLHGELPDYCLCKLSGLQVLSAQFNQLCGEIPFNMMSGLQCLTDIWLARNQFSGRLQDGLSQLSALVNINLYRNKISGHIPTSICKLHQLEFLNFGNNALTGPIPHEIISLHKLRTIALYGNQLSGAVPPWLETIPYLEELEIFNNKFEGWVPSNVADLKKRMK